MQLLDSQGRPVKAAGRTATRRGGPAPIQASRATAPMLTAAELALKDCKITPLVQLVALAMFDAAGPAEVAERMQECVRYLQEVERRMTTLAGLSPSAGAQPFGEPS